MEKRLYRDMDRAWLGGVSAGLAEYFDASIEMARLTVVALTVLSSGSGIFVYLLAWLLLPTKAEVLAGTEHGFGDAFESEVTAAYERTTAAVKSGIATVRAEADAAEGEAHAVDAASGIVAGEPPIVPVPDVEPVAAPAVEPVTETITLPPIPPSATPVADTLPDLSCDARPRSTGARWVSGTGIALILFGAAILFGRYFGWENVLSLWPVILIIVGLISAVTPEGSRGWGVDRFMSGILTAVVGFVFLAVTLGYVGWGVWTEIFRLWPIYIIAVGVWIIGSGLKSRFVSALGTLIIVLAILFGALWPLVTGGVPARGSAPRWFPGQRPSIERPRTPGATNELPPVVGHASRGELVIKGGGVEVDLYRGRGNQFAVLESAVTVNPEPFSLAARDGVAYANVDTGSAFGRGGMDNSVELSLAGGIPWKVWIDTGATDLSADLERLEVESIQLNAGAANVELALGRPAREGSRVSIAAATTHLALDLDSSTPLRFSINPGIREIKAEGMHRDGDTWVNDAYIDAKMSGRPVWDFDIASPVTNVEVRMR